MHWLLVPHAVAKQLLPADRGPSAPAAVRAVRHYVRTYLAERLEEARGVLQVSICRWPMLKPRSRGNCGIWGKPEPAGAPCYTAVCLAGAHLLLGWA